MADQTPHLTALVGEGTVRAGKGLRHLPKPTRLRNTGPSAA